jgi:D-inositol-3-phosphate glycosyltransferase
MERLAAEVEVRDRVTFLGRLSAEGVRELYARSAVVCVPSRWHEPFGYAVSEAMALGRPVVATPMGAFAELLEDGRGILSRSVTPDALAEALRTALEAPRLERAAMGAAARRFAMEALSLESIGRQYGRLYEDACS